MKRLLASLTAAALLGGCSIFAPNPPPEIVAPPPAGTGEAGGTPVESPEAAKAKPSGQEIAGCWTSKSVTGPGASSVRQVEMIFDAGGALSGAMLVESEGKKRFVAMDGTWKSEEGQLGVTFTDGRVRTWSVSWDGGAMILKDGEAEMRLERMPE